MIVFLVFCLASVSATLILTKSFLFRWLQNLFTKERHPYLNKLFNCPWCLGVWVGSLFRYLMIFYNDDLYYTLLNVFYYGLTTSILSLFTYLILLKLDFEKL